MADYEAFESGDVGLQSGITLRQVKLANKTYGTLAASRDIYGCSVKASIPPT
jgi:homoserine O-acetyltransferase